MPGAHTFNVLCMRFGGSAYSCSPTPRALRPNALNPAQALRLQYYEMLMTHFAQLAAPQAAAHFAAAALQEVHAPGGCRV